MATLKVRIQPDLHLYLLTKAKEAGYKNIQKMFNQEYKENQFSITKPLTTLYENENLLNIEKKKIKKSLLVLTGVSANCNNLEGLLINNETELENIRKIQFVISHNVFSFKSTLFKNTASSIKLKMFKSIETIINTKTAFVLTRLSEETNAKLITEAALNNMSKSLIFFYTLLRNSNIKADLQLLEEALIEETQNIHIFYEELEVLIKKHSFTIDNVNEISKEYYYKKMSRLPTVSTEHRLLNTMKYINNLTTEINKFADYK